jgi:hypothetical protein
MLLSMPVVRMITSSGKSDANAPSPVKKVYFNNKTALPNMDFQELKKDKKFGHILFETMKEDYDVAANRIQEKEKDSIILTLTDNEGMYSFNLVRASKGPINEGSLKQLSEAVTHEFENFKINVPQDFNFAYDVIDELAKKSPNETAMVWLSREKEKKIFTFADISKYSNKTANYFRSLGIKKGDKIMLVLKRHYQFWFAILALHKIGAIVIPATNQLAEKDFEYRFRAAHISAVVCTGDGETSDECDKAIAKCPEIKVKIMVNGKKDGWVTRTLNRFRDKLKDQHQVVDSDALVELLAGLKEAEDDPPNIAEPTENDTTEQPQESRA